MPKKPLGIYVHIPFCVRKCLYCDFLSDRADEETKRKYVDSLVRQIELEAAAVEECPDEYEVVSIFIGGGTPSTLPASEIDRILCKLRECFVFAEDAKGQDGRKVEISMEINPGTVSQEQLFLLHESGVNRISIGVQSLQNTELEKLGRIHKAEDFYRVYEQAGIAGFRNRNVDLMSGIPGQTVESLSDTLEQLLALQPEHISAYSLIVEEGTPFARMYPEGAVDEDTDRRMYELTGSRLAESGYHRYEISNYAKDGYICRHNEGYWTRQEYLGFGIGAASLFGHMRYSNTRDLGQYLKGNDTHEQIERLTIHEEMAETMFLGLRMTKGVSVNGFEKQYGVSMREVYGQVIDKHMRDGLLILEQGFLRLTDQGLDISNYVMADFL